MQTANAPKKHSKAQSTRERIINAARKLVDLKGFHAMTTAELAAEAGVNIALIYRHFSSKEDIVLTIAEQDFEMHIAQRTAIFDAVKRGELSVFDAIKSFAYTRLTHHEVGLFFEILAESCRNRPVAERFGAMTEMYRDGIRYLAVLARPDAPAKKLDTYVDLMIACFIGLGYRPAIGIADNPEETSYEVANLLMTALGLAEQPQRKATSRRAPRSSTKRSKG